MSVGFLGPAYSFSSRAASTLAGGRPLESCDDVEELLTRLAEKRIEAAVLPLDNSHVGHVPATAAALLAQGAPFAVRAETTLPIRFSLYRRKTDRAELHRVISHQMSLKQCAAWLAARDLATEEIGSNGMAFVQARDTGREGVGAIGPSGLEDPDMIEAETDLQGPVEFRTRFLLVQACAASDGASRALVATEQLPSLWENGVPSRVDILACLPTGRLGARMILAELVYPNRVPADALPGRALLLWSVAEAM